MRSDGFLCAQLFMIEPGGRNQMKVFEAEYVLREERGIGRLARIVVERYARFIVLVDSGVGANPLVVRTARRVQRVADRQCVAGAPAIQPASVQAGVVETLTAECGAGALREARWRYSCPSGSKGPDSRTRAFCVYESLSENLFCKSERSYSDPPTSRSSGVVV